jgi:hypothetical protein
MTARLAPDLTDGHGVLFRRYDSLPADVIEAYLKSASPDAGHLKHLSDGAGAMLQTFRHFGPRAWSLLSENLGQAYFVESRFERQPADVGALYVVVPVEAGFVSLKLQLECGELVRHATARLPEFLRPLMKTAALVGVNLRSKYLEIPDVRCFFGCGDVKVYVSDGIRGATRTRAANKFGERWEWQLHVLADDNEHNWSLFVDLDERTSEGAVWVALREDFKDVRRLINPQAAYEAMLLHYLNGTITSFDFRPYADSASIW